MRPVNKGQAPRSYRKYGDAQPDLVSQLGRFCSYCERHLPAGLAVEHKRPKSKYPAEELVWDNFLLSCPNCNSSKLAHRVILSRYIWPDADNTFRAFAYDQNGIIRVRKCLPKKLRRRARRTIILLGLDKYPGQFREPTDRDYRWADRRKEWEKALVMRRQLHEHDTPGQREAIVKCAQDGIFSIWMDVFQEDARLMQQLLYAFPGTALDCFDHRCHAVPRPGGCL